MEHEESDHLKTETLTVAPGSLVFDPEPRSRAFVEGSTLTCKDQTTRGHLDRAAHELQVSDTPVAFPTETVYGLGADATRSEAVRNIFAAKSRPVDNPLIVHFHSLPQLRSLLQSNSSKHDTNGFQVQDARNDPIPSIYRPLLERFWPGPLTIILPNPEGSQLAPEVTAGLSTFGARMPSHPVALAVLKASDRPLAAPSANASTKPSPTTAAHVRHDLRGRIRTIVDGGACDVGVESTVVDGLSSPPSILRPGGVSLEMLRQVEGWHDVTVGYQDRSGRAGDKPKAPGMKYKHYSPKATVVLFEASSSPPDIGDVLGRLGPGQSIGVIRTTTWPRFFTSGSTLTMQAACSHANRPNGHTHNTSADEDNVQAAQYQSEISSEKTIDVWDVALGNSATAIAKGLFASLRFLDQKNVDSIFVEGIDESSGDAAAAVMNRLRKAAEVKT